MGIFLHRVGMTQVTYDSHGCSSIAIVVIIPVLL